MFLKLLQSLEMNYVQITSIIQILLKQFYLASLVLVKMDASVQCLER